MKVFISILFVFCWTHFYAQFFTNSRQQYGKSRIQYKQFDWQTREYNRFKIYFYPGEENLLAYVSNAFLKEINNMEKFFNFRLDDHLDIVVYSSKSDFEQSNIGLSEENNNIGGFSKIIGSKVCIYYEGDHQQLNTQIKSAIAEVMLKKMIFGGDWKDVIKANVFSTFPSWYVNGFISYAAQKWNASIESKVKDEFLIGRFDDFSVLEGNEAKLIGHAFWHYIETTYGKHLIPRIIYVSHKTRNPSKGFEYILNKNINELVDASANFYKTTYYNELTQQNEAEGKKIDFGYKPNRTYHGFKVGPRGQKIAFVENNQGHIRIIVQDLNTEYRKTIYSFGSDLNRPVEKKQAVLAWHPAGNQLGFIAMRKGRLTFFNYNLSNENLSKTHLKTIDQVLTMDYSNDGEQILLSAASFGQTDLYLFQLSSHQLKQINNDVWDDADAMFMNNDGEIAFSSNRFIDTAYSKSQNRPIQYFENDFDVFTFKVNQISQAKIPLTRITNTPFANEKQINEINQNTLSFLSDANGLYNRYTIKKESKEAQIIPKTNRVTSIIEDVYLPGQNIFLSLIFQNYRYKLYRSEFQATRTVEIKNVYYKQEQKLFSSQLEENKQKVKISTDSAQHQVDFDLKTIQLNPNYSKQEVNLHAPTTHQKNNSYQTTVPNHQLNKKPYKINFARDFLNTKLDNQLMNNCYQRYYGSGSIYQNPRLSLLATIGFSDVFENVKLFGGFRFPFNLNAWEFIGKAQLLKRRLDHELVAYRRSYKTYDGNSDMLTKLITHTVNYTASYPFLKTLRLYGTATYRHDKRVFLSLDNPSLARPDETVHQAGLTAALVFDNSHFVQENIWVGAKMKIFSKYLNQFSPNKGMLNIGFDFRYSLKLFKNLIWVNRVASATSLGQQKLVYLVGGVSNWTLRGKNSYNLNMEIDQNQNFAYQTLVTPMRGFVQNSRNGNSFFVWNTELRLPLFSFLFKHPVKSHFLRNFQLIAFGDLGTAWTGKGPFSESNTFNTQVFHDNAVTIKLQNSINPLIFGFGLGVRMKLFGYFTRFDFGWGVQGGSISKRPLIQFSLGHDI